MYFDGSKVFRCTWVQVHGEITTSVSISVGAVDALYVSPGGRKRSRSFWKALLLVLRIRNGTRMPHNASLVPLPHWGLTSSLFNTVMRANTTGYLEQFIVKVSAASPRLVSCLTVDIVDSGIHWHLPFCHWVAFLMLCEDHQMGLMLRVDNLRGYEDWRERPVQLLFRQQRGWCRSHHHIQRSRRLCWNALNLKSLFRCRVLWRW